MFELLVVIQLAVTIVMGIYFYVQLRNARSMAPTRKSQESPREMERLRRMRAVRLAAPLAEQVRPRAFADIVGQEEGIEALKALLCSPYPQHVIIYGPPGVGKTCAARLVLEEAIRQGQGFRPGAPFVEVDATCVRFDERAIADPLIGSVHDPIYQGAGPLGQQGIPQPKPGAVTRAHGGILFIDEIGELHPIQMNKLLKVLEDRRVMLDSAYYDEADPAIPRHIHDIFRNGLPADFRLIGATTCSPSKIPPAIRSRCMEIFFRPLTREENAAIAQSAAERVGFSLSEQAAIAVGEHSEGGRDAANIVQVAAGIARRAGRKAITVADVEWVARAGAYDRRSERAALGGCAVGRVNGLAVAGSIGAILHIEASATPASGGTGTWRVTGIVEEEEISDGPRRMRRRSTAAGAVENIRTALMRMGIDAERWNLHIDFPGGMPVDGPSAGVAMAVAALSAIRGIPCDGSVALTGELSIRGEVLPVGGVAAKVKAAQRGGARRILVPRENWRPEFGADVLAMDTLQDAIRICMGRTLLPMGTGTGARMEEGEVLSAMERGRGEEYDEGLWQPTS